MPKNNEQWKPNSRFSIASFPHTSARCLGPEDPNKNTMVFKLTKAKHHGNDLSALDFPVGKILYMSPTQARERGRPPTHATQVHVLSVKGFEYGNYASLDSFVKRAHHKSRRVSRLSGILTCNIVRRI